MGCAPNPRSATARAVQGLVVMPITPQPVVKQIDHIAIRVDDPHYLFALLSDTFRLPVVWPIASYDWILSGGVFTGNVNLEIVRYGSAQNPSASEASAARLFGIAFEPYPLLESLRELVRRNIPHGPPLPVFGTRFDGFKGKLWTTSVLGGLLDGSSKPVYLGRTFGGASPVNVTLGKWMSTMTKQRWAEPLIIKAFAERMIYLTEYTHDVAQTRATGLAELKARQGGPLGVEAVQEIIVGVQNFEEKNARWQSLLAPTPPISVGYWQLGSGPAIRLEPSPEDVIQALVLKVTSIERAKAFLNEKGWMGIVAERHITIAPTKIQGLDIRLMQ